MAAKSDFSQLNRFPGETGNVFDTILHGFQIIERIPSILYGGILLLLAAIATRIDWPFTVILWGFYSVDWLLIASLPHWNRSYGPAKPTVLILAALRAVFVLLPFPISLVFQIIGTTLVIYAFWIEPHHLTVTHQSLETAKLTVGTSIKVLHLGDLHIERITQRERELQAQIDQLKPDLIVFSGDILNLSYRSDPTAMEQARQVMSQWKAPLGVYLVSGSPAVDLPENLAGLLQGLPLKWLQADKVTLPLDRGTSIDVIGLACSHRPHLDGPLLEDLIPHPPANFSLLIYHTPDLAPIAAHLGVDLMFSGHTHGGQVRIPGFGALVTGSLYGKRFEAGRIAVGSMILYVTRGIGLEGAAAPRVRLFCPPEIILWVIKGSANPL